MSGSRWITLHIAPEHACYRQSRLRSDCRPLQRSRDGRRLRVPPRLRRSGTPPESAPSTSGTPLGSVRCARMASRPRSTLTRNPEVKSSTTTTPRAPSSATNPPVVLPRPPRSANPGSTKRRSAGCSWTRALRGLSNRATHSRRCGRSVAAGARSRSRTGRR